MRGATRPKPAGMLLNPRSRANTRIGRTLKSRSTAFGPLMCSSFGWLIGYPAAPVARYLEEKPTVTAAAGGEPAIARPRGDSKYRRHSPPTRTTVGDASAAGERAWSWASTGLKGHGSKVGTPSVAGAMARPIERLTSGAPPSARRGAVFSLPAAGNEETDRLAEAAFYDDRPRLAEAREIAPARGSFEISGPENGSGLADEGAGLLDGETYPDAVPALIEEQGA